jgi:hypothetical protein
MSAESSQIRGAVCGQARNLDTLGSSHSSLPSRGLAFRVAASFNAQGAPVDALRRMSEPKRDASFFAGWPETECVGDCRDGSAFNAEYACKVMAFRKRSSVEPQLQHQRVRSQVAALHGTDPDAPDRDLRQ